MKFDYSIESLIERINNTNTREYFKEVYQTYVNGNYRSSTVMLYSTLICDLVYKLRDLRDIYGDSRAKAILIEIERLQRVNPTSPEWESKLIDMIKAQTSLLEPSDIVTIESLQKTRHLSAHPVLNNSDLLYSPNGDTVRALVRNILEGVLTNPPFFSNKIFDTMVADLADVKDRLTDKISVEKYITARYMLRLKETDFKKVFRSLWKVVFISDDENAKGNRAINLQALRVMVSNNKSGSRDAVQSEPSFYSNVTGKDHIQYLISFLSTCPDFFAQLEDGVIELIKKESATTDDFKFISWFMKSSVQEHLANLDPSKFKNITNSAVIRMKELSESNGCKAEFIDWCIRYFGLSSSFEYSKSRYEHVIQDLISEMNLKQTKALLQVANDNSQIRGRYGMKDILRVATKKWHHRLDKTKYKYIFPSK